MSDGKNGAPPAYPTGQPAHEYGSPYPPQQPVQGYPPQQQNVILRQTQPMPNDYMAFAIIVTLCCCLPLGIVAIIKSSEVRGRYTAGDYQGAEDASQEAKKWSIAGLVTGGILILLVVLFNVIIIAGTVATTSTYSY